MTDDAPREPTSAEIFASAAKHLNAVAMRTNALGDFNQRVSRSVMQSESFGRLAAAAMKPILANEEAMRRAMEPTLAQVLAMQEANARALASSFAGVVALQEQQRKLISDALARPGALAVAAQSETLRKNTELLLASVSSSSTRLMMERVSKQLGDLAALQEASLRKVFEQADLGLRVGNYMLSEDTWERLRALADADDPEEAIRDLAVDATEAITGDAATALKWNRPTKYLLQVFVFLLVWGWLLGHTWGHGDDAIKEILHVLDAFGFEHGEGEIAFAVALATGKAYDAVTETDAENSRR